MLLSYDYDFWTYLLYIFTIYGYIIIYCNAEFSDVSPHKNEKIQKKPFQTRVEKFKALW